jgi:lipid-A-disaccharide synthase
MAVTSPRAAGPAGGRRPHILMVAGEVSGDRQGSLLAGALRRLRPDLALSGVGGPEMAAAGVDLLVDSTGWGVIGYAEAYVRLPLFALRYLRLVRLVERVRPDLLLLLDFPGMNRELARRFSGRLPIAYFFPPQTYGRRGRSAARMARYAVRLLAVLPFEADAYRRAGADVVFVGHPAVDAATAAPSPGILRDTWGVGDGPLVGLLPGSRDAEVRRLLPPMLDAARSLRAAHGARFVLPLAAPRLRAAVERRVAAAGVPVRVLPPPASGSAISGAGTSLAAMAASDVVIVASGTAAVEAACLGVPMVVVYRVSRLTEWIARRFVVPPDLGREGFSIPSITLGRPVVPELLQDEVAGPRISAEAERLLTDAALRRRVADALAEVRRRLGPPGVLERAAAEVVRMLDSRAEGTLG